MQKFSGMIPLSTAKSFVFDSISPINRTESVPLLEACGRVIAEDIIATHCTPLFDRASMDGYAVRASDTASASGEKPVILPVVGAVFAGCQTDTELHSGECIKVATGSIMPPGANAVVMLEETSVEDGKITIVKPVELHAYIALKGSDIQTGDTILTSGTVLDPGKIGVLASQGITEVDVFARPTIAIISTGDEIGAVGSPLDPGKIYDINSSTLAVLVKENGCVPVVLPIIKDDKKALAEGINEALIEYDAIVTSGGSSIGEKDLTYKVLSSMGDVHFHGVHIKPGGKPTLFATILGKPVFGMPGPPTACLLNAYLLLVPVLRKMARLKVGRRRFIKARLSENLISRGDTTKPVSVRIEGNRAESVFKKAGDITSTSRGDGFIIVNAHSEILKDTEVAVELF
jgi:molybdenum cofactor synthesis domain-containing protein